MRNRSYNLIVPVFCFVWLKLKFDTSPKINIAPENGWFEYDPFLLGRPIFRGYVSFREGNRSSFFLWLKLKFDTSPKINIAPENGWFEYDPFLLGFGLFSGAKTLVSGRVIVPVFCFVWLKLEFDTSPKINIAPEEWMV